MTDRDELIKNFLGQPQEKTFHLRDHASIACLAFLLFLEPAGENAIEDDASTLCHLDEFEEGYTGSLIEKFKTDKPIYECYSKAVEALKAGQIEEYVPDPKPSPYPPSPCEPQAYSVSFLIWAEKEGYTIPAFVLKNINNKAAFYGSGQSSRAQEKVDFPALTQEDLTHLAKEPLWYLHKAVLYALGHKSTKKLEDVARFYQYKDVAKQLFIYIDDAQKAGSLKLVHSEPMADGTRNLFTAQVAPTHFVEWARTLPLYLPGFSADQQGSDKKEEKELSSRERTTLLKMIIGMAVEQYDYEPTAKKSDATQNIISDLEQCGLGLDANTVRKKLKEASELLPQDYWNKGKAE